jgi:hypothetical protein
MVLLYLSWLIQAAGDPRLDCVTIGGKKPPGIPFLRFSDNRF